MQQTKYHPKETPSGKGKNHETEKKHFRKICAASLLFLGMFLLPLSFVRAEEAKEPAKKFPTDKYTMYDKIPEGRGGIEGKYFQVSFIFRNSSGSRILCAKKVQETIPKAAEKIIRI